MANDIIVSEMTSASQINTNDLMIMTQPDLQAETGYSTKKGTVLQVANKMLKGTEYLTDLPDFTDKTVLGGLEELKGDLTALLPVDTASGAIANFDTDLSLPLVDCKANIVASQQSGTPTPSSPLAISGYTGMNLSVVSDSDLAPYLKGIYEGKYDFVDLGSLTYVQNNTNQAGKYRFGASVSPLPKRTSTSTDTPNILCNGITTETPSRTYACNNGITIGNTDSALIYIYIEDYCTYTPEQFKSAMSGKYLIYELATPQTPTITPTQFNTLCTAFNATGTLYPVSWQTEAGTVYGGNLDLTTGVLTVAHSVKLGNELAWSEDDTSTPTHRVWTAVISGKAYGVSNTISSFFSQTTQSYANMPEYTLRGTGNSARIYVCDSDYSTADAFKSGIATAQFVYPLATPVTYQLTPVQVQALLGVNNVFNDTNGDTEVKYKEGIQHYIDKKIAATQALIL